MLGACLTLPPLFRASSGVFAWRLVHSQRREETVHRSLFMLEDGETGVGIVAASLLGRCILLRVFGQAGARGRRARSLPGLPRSPQTPTDMDTDTQTQQAAKRRETEAPPDPVAMSLSSDGDALSAQVLARFGRDFDLTEYMASLVKEVTGGGTGPIDQAQETDVRTIISKLTAKRKAIDGVLGAVTAKEEELNRELMELEKTLAVAPVEAGKMIEETTNTVATLQTEISAIRKQYAAPGHRIHQLETEITNMDKTKLLSELFGELLLSTAIALLGKTPVEQGQMILERSNKASALPLPLLEFLRVPNTMPEGVNLLSSLAEASKVKGTMEVTVKGLESPTTKGPLPNLPSSILSFVKRPGAFPRQEEEISKLTEKDWRAEELTNYVQMTWLYIEKASGYIKHSLLASAGPQQQKQQAQIQTNSDNGLFDCDDIMTAMPIPPPVSKVSQSDSPALILRLRLLALCFSHSTDTLNKLSKAISKRLLIHAESRLKEAAQSSGVRGNTIPTNGDSAATNEKNIAGTNENEPGSPGASSRDKVDLSRLIIDSISQLRVSTSQAITMCCDVFPDPRSAFDVYLDELDRVAKDLITAVLQTLKTRNFSSNRTKELLGRLRIELGSLYSELLGVKCVGRSVNEIDKEGTDFQELLRPKLSEQTRKTFLGKLSIPSSLTLEGMNKMRSIELDQETANKHYTVVYSFLISTLSNEQGLRPENIFVNEIESFFNNIDKENPLIKLSYLLSSQQQQQQQQQTASGMSSSPNSVSSLSLHSAFPIYKEDKPDMFKELLISQLSEAIRTMQAFYCSTLDKDSESFSQYAPQFEKILTILLERAEKSFGNGLDFLSKLVSVKIGNLYNCGYLSEAGDGPDFFGVGAFYKSLKGGQGFVEKQVKPTRFVVPLVELVRAGCKFMMMQTEIARSYFNEVLRPLVPSKAFNTLTQLLETRFLFVISQKISILLQRYCDAVCASVACMLFTSHTQACFQEAENGIPSDAPASWICSFVETEIKALKCQEIPEDTRHHVKHNMVGRLTTLFILDICRFDVSLDGGFHLIPYLNTLSELVEKNFESPDLAELLKAISSLYVADRDKIKNFLCSSPGQDSQSAISYFWDKLVQNKEGLRFLKALLKARRDMKKMKDDEFTALLREIHNASG